MPDRPPSPTRGPAKPAVAAPKRAAHPVHVGAPPTARVGTGNDLLDNLLQGGLPRGSSCLLLGPPFSGKGLVAGCFAQAAAQAPEPLVVLLTKSTPGRFRAATARLGHDFAALEREGMVAYIDCYGATLGARVQDPLVASSPAEPSGEELREALAQARERLGKPASFRLVAQGLTDLLLRSGDDSGRAGHPWLQRVLGDLRAWEATSLFTAEEGVHPAWELALLRHLSDGAIEFKESDDSRTFLRVRGLGGVVTRDWIEYVAGPRGLDIVGSFSERKIR